MCFYPFGCNYSGYCLFLLAMKFMSGSVLKDIVDIEYIKPHFDGPGLFVDNIYMMNIGLPEKQELILKHGMGFILTPKNFNSAATIANLGRRQAILFDVSNVLGFIGTQASRL